MWLSVFTVGNYGELFSNKMAEVGFDAANIIIICVATAIVTLVNALLVKKGSDLRVALRERPFLSYTLFALVIVAIVLFGAYGEGYDASDFIYGQF